MSTTSGEIGQRIRVARELAQLRAWDMAVRLEVVPITIYRWEKGVFEPSVAMLRRIAEVTEVDLGWLVTGKGCARECCA